MGGIDSIWPMAMQAWQDHATQCILCRMQLYVDSFCYYKNARGKYLRCSSLLCLVQRCYFSHMVDILWCINTLIHHVNSHFPGTIQPSRSTRSLSLVTLLHPQAQSSLKITNCSFRYAAPHLWNKLPPSVRVPCQSATSECSFPLPGSDSAPKSVVGVSHRVSLGKFSS